MLWSFPTPLPAFDSLLNARAGDDFLITKGSEQIASVLIKVVFIYFQSATTFLLPSAWGTGQWLFPLTDSQRLRDQCAIQFQQMSKGEVG